MAISTAVDNSAVARVVGIKTQFKDLRGGAVVYLPQRIALIGQGSSSAVYSTKKQEVYTAGEVGEAYGFGSPLHLAMLQLRPTNGDGVGTIPVTVYPLADDDEAVAATGVITPVGTQTTAAAYKVRVNNIESEQFVIAKDASVGDVCASITESINAVLEMPVIAVNTGAQVDLTSKWKGESANAIYVEVEGSTAAGTSFGITQLSGGLVNPNVDDALNQIGDVWESMLLNCMNAHDTTTLDKIQTFGEGRWGALTRKPFISFYGNTATEVNDATQYTDERKQDRSNVQLVAPGSVDLPFVVAARQVARIAPVANNNPAHDYGSQQATGLTPGDDADQWNYVQRDSAVKKGSSTIEVKDGVINVSDVVTCYHPTNEPIPGFRYVCDIVKLQTVIFNIDLEFNQPKWDGAPLIPDHQATTNRAAKKPKTAVAAVGKILDSLGLEAIISDPETAKANTFAEIDSQNPKRLNLATTVQVSGNTNIKSIDLNFGFYFGTSTVVA